MARLIRIVTPQEGEALDALSRGFGAAQRVSPHGPPIYRRLLSMRDSGFALYSNGICARWCLGNKEQFRFVSFADLSGVFPVRRNPGGRYSPDWGALQFETKAGLVFVLSSGYHRFERLVPLVRKTIGPRWNELYHRGEVLWTPLVFAGQVLDGDAFLHESVRRSRGLAPRRYASGAPGEGVPEHGDLVFEESEDSRRARATSMSEANSRAAIFAGSFYAASLVFLAVFRLPPVVSIFIAFMVCGMAAAMFTLCIQMRAAAFHMAPVRVFKLGVELPRLRADPSAVFVPFGGIRSFKVLPSKLGRPALTIESPGFDDPVRIPIADEGKEKTLRSLSEEWAIARSTARRSDFQPGRIKSHRYEHIFHVSAVSAGVGIAAPLLIAVQWEIAIEQPILVFLMASAGAVLCAETLVLRFLRTLPFLEPSTLDFRTPWKVMLGAGFAFLAGVAGNLLTLSEQTASIGALLSLPVAFLGGILVLQVKHIRRLWLTRTHIRAKGELMKRLDLL